MRVQRSALRNNGVHFSPRDLVRVMSALLNSRQPSHRKLGTRVLRDTPLGRQIRLILLLERRHQTAEQIEEFLGCCRRTVFRYLVRLEELGVKVGLSDSQYHVMSMEQDLRQLTIQLKRALPGRQRERA